MQELYGFHWKRADRTAVSGGTALILATAKAKMPYDKVLPELRAKAATHSFGGSVKRRKAEERVAHAPSAGADPTPAPSET